MPFSSVNGTIISAPDVHAFNFVNNQTEVVPKPLALPASVAPNQTKFDWQVPAYSITVLQFQV